MKQIYKYRHNTWKLTNYGCLTCSRSFWTFEDAVIHYEQCRLDKQAVEMYLQLEQDNPDIGKNHLKILVQNKINTLYGRVTPVTIMVPRPYVEGAKRGAKTNGNIATDTCPHCGKTGGKNGIVRWHYDNCRDKPDDNTENNTET